jgi:hypothetical protein
MLPFIKKLFFGTLIGISYCFVSYYLLNPNTSSINYSLIVSFGIQGAIFSASFTVLGLLIKKYKTDCNIRLLFLLRIINGALSGLLSGSFNMLITYSSNISPYNGLAPAKLKMMLFTALVKYSIGCILIGIFVGSLVAYVEWKGTKVGTDSERPGRP